MEEIKKSKNNINQETEQPKYQKIQMTQLKGTPKINEPIWTNCKKI